MNYAKKKTENLYVILLSILMVIAVVCAIIGALNRSKQSARENETTAKITETTEPVQDDDDDEDEKDDEEKTDAEDVFNETPDATQDKLPEFSNPTGGCVLKDFSEETPVFSVTMEDYRTHHGVDVFVDIGERILSAADGTVKEIWEDPMMGTCLSVEHTGGAVSIYKNVSPELPEEIQVGSEVKGGQLIAVGGESALCEIAEEPHLHFELEINGVGVNPCDYIVFPENGESFEG